MKRTLTSLRKALLSIIFLAVFGGMTKATTYTAVVSGNFNSALTWGGVIPGSLLSTDIVIIPLGINVTLTTPETFSGTASLIVNGTLTATTSAAPLIMTSGSLLGAGFINVDSVVLGLTSGFSFTGGLTAHTLTSLGASLSSAANVTVSSMLALTSGSLSVTAGSLTMGNNSNITLSGGTLSVSGAGSVALDSTYSVTYTTTSATTGLELHGSGIGNITVNVPGTVTLSADDTVKGWLTLTSGTLSLNGHTLTFGATGNLSASGSGMLSGSVSSGITINTNSSLSGSLNFAGGGDVLNNLTLNMTSGSDSVALGSSLTLYGTLGLHIGKLRLGNNNLTLSTGAMVSGGTSGSYVLTNGTGNLIMNLSAGNTDTFAVGTSANFSPMTVFAGTGSATGNVSVSAMNGVLSGGISGTLISATQPMVNTTWFVSSTAMTTSINYTLTAMWNAGMEVNSFDRAHAYISHFTGGVWDTTAMSAAGTSGSLYTMTRAGITSLSPFSVMGRSTGATLVQNVFNNNEIDVYPNPASNTLYFSGNNNISNVTVYDLMGKAVLTSEGNANTLSIQDLPTGTYIVRLTGNNVNAVKKFVKE